MTQLYHGTDAKFKVPKLELCNPYTDFGRGFYLTHELERAKEWGANRNGTKYRVNVYTANDKYIHDAQAAGLQIKLFTEATAEWARFVYQNRYDEDFTHPYDIVIGPVADNALQVKFAEMQRHDMSFDDIAPQIKYHKFKKPQICFCTTTSLELIKYSDTYAYSNRTTHKHGRR